MPAWGDFGMGLSEEERKRAMREAIFRAGLAVQKRAGSEGFGAIAGLTGNIGMGLHDAGAGMLEQRAAQAKAAEAQRQQALEDESRKLNQEKVRRSLLEGEAEGDEKRRELERRKAAIAQVADPKKRALLELAIGQSNFANLYRKVTAEPLPEKPERPAPFADGTTRLWNPSSGKWEIAARKPEKAEGEGKAPKGKLSADEIELAARKAAMVRLAQRERDIVEGKIEKPPPMLPAQAMAAKKARLEKFLAEERERLAFEQGLEPIPNARSGEPFRKQNLPIDLNSPEEQMIARELAKVPPSRRREAEAELRLIIGRRNL